MKTIAFLLIFSAVPAFAQELPTDGSIFEVLKLGDWVSYRSVTTGDMLDVTIVNKPAGTTIKAYRDKLTKESQRRQCRFEQVQRSHSGVADRQYFA